jgi:hypothetical protein
MSAAIVLRRLRRFLLVFSALLFGGAVLELLLVEHTADFVQLIPFAQCGLGLVAVLAALWRPRRGPLLALRVCMGLVVLGSLFGVYEHVTNNMAFEREINPGASTGAVIRAGIKGANPLLAPGILAAAAVLALAATYRPSDPGDDRDAA